MIIADLDHFDLLCPRAGEGSANAPHPVPNPAADGDPGRRDSVLAAGTDRPAGGGAGHIEDPTITFARGNRRLAARRLADREAAEKSAEVVRLQAALNDFADYLRLMMPFVDMPAFVKAMTAMDMREGQKPVSTIDSSEGAAGVN